MLAIRDIMDSKALSYKGECSSASDKLDMDHISIEVPSGGFGHTRLSPARAASKKDQRCRPEPHWSTTADGALLSRATAYVYTKIISSSKDGGLNDFLHENCGKFLCVTEDAFELEHMELFKQYESKIAAILDAFAEEEGLSPHDLAEKVQSVCAQSKGAEKNMSMLLAASNFRKFIHFMRSKAAQAAVKALDGEKMASVLDHHH